MSHPQQQAFCESVKARFPQFFSGTMVLDIGSLDINGNNQVLFDADSLYLGLDIAAGRNVDIICPGHELGLPDATFDIVVSTECFEHDRYWVKTLNNAIRLLRPGGMLLMTCATTGRPEHGTRRTTPNDAPLLSEVDDEWADYYRNLDEQDVRAEIDVPGLFQFAEFSIGKETCDLYFVALKHGVFERRLNRSTSVASHPAKLLVNELRTQLQRSFEHLHQVDAERSSVLSILATEQQSLQSEKLKLAAMTEELHRLQSRNQVQQETLEGLYNSKSWRLTSGLRWGVRKAGKARTLARLMRNGLRYVARGDFSGLRQRIRAFLADRATHATLLSGPPKHWCVMATPHTLFIAHLIASRLRAHGWEVDVTTTAPVGFPHQMYIVVCPQMFKQLPPGERRIVYQMEQSVSSRWFTAEYFSTLEKSVAVLEYALVNVEFMAKHGIVYPHVYYLPVGADVAYAAADADVEKEYDVLFYGDANSSVRRREMLATLAKHFKVRVCSEIFGAEMNAAIRSARLVINLHYYENALLEMPRIQECLSLGVPVVSESAQDQSDYPELAGAVMFFKEGDSDAMIEAVRHALETPVNVEVIQHSAGLSAQRFGFMFDRFLVSMNLIPASHITTDSLPLPPERSRIALSMPETIARRRIFEANKPQDCAVFDGMRLRPGWVGCGLSYSVLARHALKNGLQRLMIIEDDALLPPDFEAKMLTVNAYLDARPGQWDIFAGMIASLHPETKILHSEVFDGIRFVTLDKMTSMVCNIYSEAALRLLSAWDPEHRNDQTNTIDKYLERQTNLQVVVALPFLAGHREEVSSTLWGFQNTQYSDMILNSERALLALADNSLATAS
jgi:SAM-dependent methyltransferase